MTDLKRPIIIMMIILGFLMPGGFLYSYERNAGCKEEGDTGTIKDGDIDDPRVFSSSDRTKFNDFVYPSPQRERTRGQNGDLMMDWDGMLKYADISDAPFQTLYQDIQGSHDFMWGEKNTTITYHPIIKNDGNVQIIQFKLRLVVHEVYHNDGGNWRIRRELVNKTKNIGPLSGNTNTSNQGLNTSISWTPKYAGRIRMMLKIEVVGDPDLTNNALYFWPYIMEVHNEVETASERGQWKSGSGWSITTLNANDDPNPDYHSAPTVWECDSAGVQYLKMSVDLSDCVEDELPFFGEPNAWGSRGVFIGWTFAGSAATSSWKVDFWNGSSGAWENKHIDTQGIDDSWYRYRYGDWNIDGYNLFGTFLDEYFCTADFKIRMTGTNHYIDDLWICSLENIPDMVSPTHVDNSNKTGTTGDDFTFRINATDDVEIDKVYVNWKHGNSAQNLSLDKATGYWIGNATLEHILDKLTYTIYVNDTSNNFNVSGVKNVDVFDNDPPEYSDESPADATTGDAFTFNIAASDNIGMGNVFVNWKHGNLNQNLSLNEVGGNWVGTVTLDHSIDDLTYVSYAKDNLNNCNTSEPQTVNVADNDIPSFSDQSPNDGSTGDQFSFAVTASDNIDIGSVHADWSHGNLGGNCSLAKVGNNWESDITLDHSLDPLTYTIYVADSSNNFNNSGINEVDIFDNDIPGFTDNSPGEGTTGDEYTFDVVGTDNIGVDEVYLIWSHGSLGANISLTETVDHWAESITLDHSLEDLSYTITMIDTSGNIKTGSEQTVGVTDNDKPSIIDISENMGTTGDQFTFNISTDDNMAVESVYVEWVHGESSDNVSLDLLGEYWVRPITLNDDISDLTYTIFVMDASNNFNVSDTQTISVTDNDPPASIDRSDDSGTTGDDFQFKVEASDNIDVEAVHVNWQHGELGNNISLLLDGDYWLGIATLDNDVGNLTFTVYVKDMSGNYFSGSLRAIPVTDNDPPTADAGPDKSVERGIEVHFNGEGSTDNVGIVNYTWSFTYDEGEIFLYDSAPTFLFNISGEYAVTLIVEDASGNTRNSVINITVTPKDGDDDDDDTGDDDTGDDDVGDDDTGDDDAGDDDTGDDDTGDDDTGDDDTGDDDTGDDDTGGKDQDSGGDDGSFLSSNGGMAMIGVIVLFLIIIIILIVIIVLRSGGKKKEETEELPREPDLPPAEEETVEIREETLSEGPVGTAEADPMPTFFEDKKEIANSLFYGINESFKEGMALGIDLGKYRSDYENAIASFKAGDFDSAVDMFGAIRDRLGREMESRRNPMLGQGDRLEDLFALPGYED